jgi:hypothetical protein
MIMFIMMNMIMRSTSPLRSPKRGDLMVEEIKPRRRGPLLMPHFRPSRFAGRSSQPDWSELFH